MAVCWYKCGVYLAGKTIRWRWLSLPLVGSFTNDVSPFEVTPVGLVCSMLGRDLKRSQNTMSPPRRELQWTIRTERAK